MDEIKTSYDNGQSQIPSETEQDVRLDVGHSYAGYENTRHDGGKRGPTLVVDYTAFQPVAETNKSKSSRTARVGASSSGQGEEGAKERSAGVARVAS